MLRHRRVTVGAAALSLGVVLTGVLGTATPASAHITVDPKQAAPGEYARLSFRVPTESDTASTTRVEVVLPPDAPVASVSTKPVPGWTVTIERQPVDPPLEVHGAQVTEAVSRIIWAATDPEAGIKPVEFQEFPVSMGPLPEVEQLVFKALQTYSDGTIVRWIEVPVPGQEEPATPAIVLRLAPAGDDPAASGEGPGPDLAGAEPGTAERDGVAFGLGIAGLVTGVGGLVLGGLALARVRRAEAVAPVVREDGPAD